jgi:hypothetical protein
VTGYCPVRYRSDIQAIYGLRTVAGNNASCVKLSAAPDNIAIRCAC